MGRWLLDLPGRIWRACLAAGSLRLWAIILGAPPLTALAVWLVGVVKSEGWPEGLRAAQLTILGNALYIVLGIVAIIVVALSLVTVRATLPGGASLSIGGDDDEPGPTVTTTTTTRVDPPADPNRG